ncbi:MAG: hypothetical protein ACSLFC_04510 [Desulfuromonadales bacterium]
MAVNDILCKNQHMRRFVNIYIILFLIDAGLSLIAELLAATSSPLPLVAGLRYSVAYVVIILSMVIYACLGIDRRLPKRVLLPLTLYVFWNALAMWPLSGIIGRDSLGLIAAAGQLLLGGIAVLLLRSPDGKPLLSGRQLRTPMFSWRNTLSFSAINLLLLPFVLVYSGLAMTSDYLEQQTSGFMRLSPIGIYMSERSYHLDKKVIRLAAMMHIGREDYYEDLSKSMSNEETIILAEGVTDRDKLLDNRFNYSKLAGLIGLSSQETMRFGGNLIDLHHLEATGSDAGEQGKVDIAHADIDVSQFDPETIAFLNELGRTLFGDKPLVEGLAEYNAWVSEQMTPEWIAGVMSDILDKRNAVVIGSMVRSLAYYDTIVIPWGAMHMPAIETAVLNQGFVPGAERERLSVDFRAIPYAELWRKFAVDSDVE